MTEKRMTEPTVRDRILDTLLDLTADRGAEGVTVREVATAAGVSIGTVQYYCHSKEQMLTMAFDEVNRRIIARVNDIQQTGTVGAVLRRALLEFLPLDAARRREASVYLAFSTRAVVLPALAAIRHDLIADQHRLCADAFRLAHERGETLADVDPDSAAWTTVALIDGLLLNLLSDPTGLSADDAIGVVDRHLGALTRI
ncbi:TetR/AcrR family transcriptional regulator [Gordonia neofelifaecis]|uniref:Transcriptional regulator, TetR family protein n=1 Tax=Gordonia neofelifaecis NRRL B-59395 TaxID=644548 RepID=F1YE07_9ACTN|nr:TetR/AcrR family transcriptional regulator [Gordonia neofelifaecis]EGD57097.1 transcriptional regulator, TetR family protein [Gordonia neofelifaecis NRRL B-59395]